LDPNCPWYLFSSFVRCKVAFFSAHCQICSRLLFFEGKYFECNFRSGHQ
jgi:hypothetical protein